MYVDDGLTSGHWVKKGGGVDWDVEKSGRDSGQDIYRVPRYNGRQEFGDGDAVVTNANEEPGSIMVVIKTYEEKTESKSESVNQRRDKECNHKDERKTLYNRTRGPDWDDIETQE